MHRLFQESLDDLKGLGSLIAGHPLSFIASLLVAEVVGWWLAKGERQ